MKKNLVLATTSIPRKQAFDELDIPYEAIGSNIEEDFKGRPTKPRDLVLCLAKLKAQNVAKKRPDSLVIGFDSIGYFNGKILEKPISKQEAFERLMAYSGNFYEFFTGIHLIERNYNESKVVVTKVKVRELDKNEIIKYLRQDGNFGRYSQGFNPLNTFGASFIKEIEGSYNNILRGIPLEIIVDMIKKRGFEIKNAMD
ncbi:7-methyl-GTP pyrophosphatase [subsurface metagenome]